MEKKEEEKKDFLKPSRKIPTEDIHDFKIPDSIKRAYRPKKVDRDIISSIRKDLLSSGAISGSGVFSETYDSVTEIMSQANEGSVFEKDFNPESYDEDLLKEIEDLDASREKDWDNPLLEEYD